VRGSRRRGGVEVECEVGLSPPTGEGVGLMLLLGEVEPQKPNAKSATATVVVLIGASYQGQPVL